MKEFIKILEYLASEDSETKDLKTRIFPDSIEGYTQFIQKELFIYFFSIQQMRDVVNSEISLEFFDGYEDHDRQLMLQAYKMYLSKPETED